MLYKFLINENDIKSLEPLPYLESSELLPREKDLENLIAANLLDVLFEDSQLMPIFQERQQQPEADIYALDRSGDLHIFELKRGVAFDDAILQAIGYMHRAGHWMFSRLQDLYTQYAQHRGSTPNGQLDLRTAHAEAFQLGDPLAAADFNKRQHLRIVGNAANESLSKAISYWRAQGLSIDFLPYRIYEIGAEQYFEFFSPPFDQHRNPTGRKGVLFDTNKSFDENSIWEMIERKRISAYGEVKEVVRTLQPKDCVFFYHAGSGVVAAAEVLPGSAKHAGSEEMYKSVRFLTDVPSKGEPLNAMPISQVMIATGKTFFLAKTIKNPSLTADESDALLENLKTFLSSE